MLTTRPVILWRLLMNYENRVIWLTLVLIRIKNFPYCETSINLFISRSYNFVVVQNILWKKILKNSFCIFLFIVCNLKTYSFFAVTRCRVCIFCRPNATVFTRSYVKVFNTRTTVQLFLHVAVVHIKKTFSYVSAYSFKRVHCHATTINFFCRQIASIVILWTLSKIFFLWNSQTLV